MKKTIPPFSKTGTGLKVPEINNMDKIEWWEEIIFSIERIWEKISYFPKDIKHFVQRGIRGYADCDTWDFDFYLSSMIPKALRQLAKKTDAWPGYKNRDFKDYKGWKKVLREIADGFEAIDKIKENMFVPTDKKYKKLWDKWEKGSKLFIKYYGHFWW